VDPCGIYKGSKRSKSYKLISYIKASFDYLKRERDIISEGGGGHRKMDMRRTLERF